MACQPKLCGRFVHLRQVASADSLRLASQSEGWWARVELNHRPHAYQACALTT